MVITRRYSGANLMLNSSLDKHSGPDFESLLDKYFMPRYMVITRKYPGAYVMVNSAVLVTKSGPDFELLLDKYFMP